MIGLDVLTRQVNVNHGGLDTLTPEDVQWANEVTGVVRSKLRPNLGLTIAERNYRCSNQLRSQFSFAGT